MDCDLAALLVVEWSVSPSQLHIGEHSCDDDLLEEINADVMCGAH